MNYIHTLTRYYQDLYGWDTIEVEDSFLAFSLENESLNVCEFYVPPEKRKKGIAKKLINTAIDIAIKNNCKDIRAKIELVKNGQLTMDPSLSLKVILGHGFVPYGAENNEIYVIRELKKYE